MQPHLLLAGVAKRNRGKRDVRRHEKDKESAKEAEKETREEEEKEESETKREEEEEEAKEQQDEDDAAKKEIEAAGKEEQDEAESIAKESRKEAEKENAESKESEVLEKNTLKTNTDSPEIMQNDMKNIEKDAEKEVDNEFRATDEQYLHPPNTTKLENEIKQLDKKFGEHIKHAIGVIVNSPSNESKIVGSRSNRSNDDLAQGSAGANLDRGVEALPIIGNRMNDIPRAVEALRLQAATTFLGSENGVGINMTTGEETASQQLGHRSRCRDR